MNDRGPAPNSHGTGHGAVSGEQPTMAAPTPAPALSGRAAGAEEWSGREVGGRYKVLERLGEGGMGMVYVAEHLHLKKRVAFKVIHPELAAHEELLLRFKREALATGQLEHPHIASAIDFGELDDGGAFMVMPLVRGPSLHALLAEGKRADLRRVATLGSQIADALSAAHAVGIVHRDLKPDNVLLEVRGDGSEAAKVLDFGVASLSGHGGSTHAGLKLEARPLTQAGTILGTPGYMSPEQASAGEIDHRTDLYALGVILWELCRGERLFDGDNITAIFAKQFNALPPALDLGAAENARALSDLVGRLLAWDKHQRPGSAAEVRDNLRRIAELSDTRSSVASVARQPEGFKRYLPYVVGALSVLVAILIVALDDDDETISPEDAPAAQTTEVVKPPAPSKAQGSKKPLQPPPPKAETARVSKGEANEGSSLREAQSTLLASARKDARRTAAKRLLEDTDAVPRYVSLMAELELASRCNEKKELLEQMRTLGDPRVLPALERLAETPRRGCGFVRLNDCLGCLRRELGQTIDALDSIAQ